MIIPEKNSLLASFPVVGTCSPLWNPARRRFEESEPQHTRLVAKPQQKEGGIPRHHLPFQLRRTLLDEASNRGSSQAPPPRYRISIMKYAAHVVIARFFWVSLLGLLWVSTFTIQAPSGQVWRWILFSWRFAKCCRTRCRSRRWRRLKSTDDNMAAMRHLLQVQDTQDVQRLLKGLGAPKLVGSTRRFPGLMPVVSLLVSQDADSDENLATLFGDPERVRGIVFEVRMTRKRAARWHRYHLPA